MRKLIILIGVLGTLIFANIIISNTSSKKESKQKLSDAIVLDNSLSSFVISINDNKIALSKDDSCYKIKSINYCADHNQVQLFNKFLNNEVNDIYENSLENRNRLGFVNKKNINSVLINNRKTLLFGNINQYSEIYVQESNKIYKVDFFKDILDISTNKWIDKSKPIIDIVESDEFDVVINLNDNENNCINIPHKKIINNQKYSTLRNSFFDLYASDVKIWNGEFSNNSVLIVHLKNKHNKKVKNTFYIWKEDHLVYFYADNVNKQKFVIPNSVFENIKSYCKK